MHEDLEKVKLLARDLRDGKEFPRSPRATLGGYVLAARAVDKCRAVLVDWQGEYHSNCPLDQRWLNFAEIDYGDFRSLVEALQGRGVRVTVVSTIESRPPVVADELRRQADVFIDLMELKPKIFREERSQGPRVIRP